MPRLPTIRVIGSQFISTSLPGSAWRSGSRPNKDVAIVAPFEMLLSVVSGRALGTVVAPARLGIQRRDHEFAQRHDPAAVRLNRVGGETAAGWLVHERHELVGESGHGASDADAAHVRTPADPAHPAALGD